MAVSTKKTDSCGACSIEGQSPKLESLSSTTKVVNLTIRFEEALKLNVAIQECVSRLNRYNRATAAGKKAAMQLVVYMDKGRLQVIEGKL
jgi:hypothetical protein